MPKILVAFYFFGGFFFLFFVSVFFLLRAAALEKSCCRGVCGPWAWERKAAGSASRLAGKQEPVRSKSQGLSRRSRLPPEKRDNFCSVRVFLPCVSRYPASAALIPAGEPGSCPGVTGHQTSVSNKCFGELCSQRTLLQTAKQGPSEQSCSSGSAETGSARKSRDQVSILVFKASGDAHMEGVKEEQIMQQTQQMSRPADGGTFEGSHPQQLKSAAM